METDPTRFVPAARDEAGRVEYWAALALRYCDGLGALRAKTLLEHFGSARAAVQGVGQWSALDLPARAIASMRAEKWRDKARLEWDSLKDSPSAVLLWTDPEYPALLRSIDDPPSFLYFRGDIRLLSNLCVAVVGARECSVEGLRATVHISRGLAAAGVTIVSGLARGIDRAAHLSGLEQAGGSIAVLGCGLDVPYPKSNLDLRALLGEKGLMLTEYGPGTAGLGRHFIIRNRIISGISRAVVVAEAAPRSGSLNTARHALEQNRELMAVPGTTGARHAEGCKDLIRRGAKPVFAADDVLRELLPFLTQTVRDKVRERDLTRFQAREKRVPDLFPLELAPGPLPWDAGGQKKRPPVTDTPPKRARTKRMRQAVNAGASEKNQTAEKHMPAGVPKLAGPAQEIISFIQDSPRHIDDICRTLGQTADVVSVFLLQLELEGLVRRLPGMVYALP